MANGYTAHLDSVVSDGTNYYCQITISNGTYTFPPIFPAFAVGTTGAAILSYMQTIVTAAPTLAGDVSAVVGKSVSG